MVRLKNEPCKQERIRNTGNLSEVIVAVFECLQLMPVTLEKHKLLQKHCFAEYEEEADEMA